MAENYLREIISNIQAKLLEQDAINRQTQEAISGIGTDIINLTNDLANHEVNCPYSDEAVKTIVEREYGKRKEKTWKRWAKYIGFITAVATLVITVLKLMEVMGVHLLIK